MELVEACTKYVSFLRSLYLIHQNSHWVISGKHSYGSHLLFERLYQAAQENADAAAEKFVGVFNDECLNLKRQAVFIAEFLNKYASQSPMETSLVAVKDFLAFSKEFHQFLKDQDKMTQGIDDMLFAIANKQEEAVYLLKQNGANEMNKVSTLANKFKAKLAQQAPNLSPEQVQAKTDEMKLQEAGENVKRSLVQDLGLKNVQAVDMKFGMLRFSQDKSGIEYDLQISPTLAPQIKAAVERNKQTHPSFLLGNHVVNLFKQFYPGLPARGTVRVG